MRRSFPSTRTYSRDLMGIHGDDIVRTIRAALVDSDMAAMQTNVCVTPRDDSHLWLSRDGLLTFEAIGRDWFRGFRITVEVIPTEDVSGDLERVAAKREHEDGHR